MRGRPRPEGRGLPAQEDKVQAVYWYQKAAAQADREATIKLGKCYETGQGVAVGQQPTAQGSRLVTDCFQSSHTAD